MVSCKTCVQNIYNIAKKKNIKIGDIESYAGVSIGYLSRLNKEEKNSYPSIEVLNSASIYLSVSIDYLVNYDTSTFSIKESKLIDFFDRITVKTNNESINWYEETIQEMNELSYTYDGIKCHPLFYVGSNTNNNVNFDMNFENYNIAKYNSLFLKNDIEPSSSAFFFEFQKNKYFYLIKNNLILNNDNHNLVEEYECYFITRMSNHVDPICYGTKIFNNNIFKSLSNLYQLARDASNKIKLSTDVEKDIDNFMKS